MRSVSFSDEAPPAIPPRTFPPPRAAHRRQTSAESLPLYENSEMNNDSSVSKNLRLNSLPRMIPHHRRKILDFNRPSSSLAGHYQYLGDPLPDYANLTNISRRGTFYNQRQNSLKQGWLTFLPFKSQLTHVFRIVVHDNMNMHLAYRLWRNGLQLRYRLQQSRIPTQCSRSDGRTTGFRQCLFPLFLQHRRLIQQLAQVRHQYTKKRLLAVTGPNL